MTNAVHNVYCLTHYAIGLVWYSLSMKTPRAELIRKIYDLKDQLAQTEKLLAQQHSMYWSADLGWVTIPGPELDEEMARLMEGKKS